MDSERWKRVRELFESALDLPEDEREEFVSVASSTEPDVLAEVRRMLEADREESSIVDIADRAAQESRAEVVPVPEIATTDEVEGTRIGAYALRRVIASGGMGTVYEAEQERPRRRVALKMLRLGLGPSALRRFQYESEILAHLRHPGIAQVYEAGTHTEQVGPQTLETPWYAMEFVEGARTLAEYAATSDLTQDQRLGLFLQVVDAVHYGHQKGVIHRDIKPGNILVDAHGRVKVIDFGIARATNVDEVRQTMQTEAGEILGTLQYMSPEQLDTESDVDTRTDVYALGMVLYEILCRRLPYDVTRKAIHEAARIIHETAPTRPSTIMRSLSGDVEAICLKALEKDPRRRYASAEALGSDIRRFLTREPIEARPPSVTYQLSMFAQRNRVLVSAAVAILVVLVVATGVSVNYAFVATKAGKAAKEERDAAVIARDAETRERTRAEHAEREAEERLIQVEEESKKSGAVSEYLAELLSSADPGKAGREARVTDLLARARLEVGSRFAAWPDVRAELLGVVGTTYMGLGLLEESETEIRRALATLDETGVPPEAPERIELELNLGSVLFRRGEIAASEELMLDVIARLDESLGEDHEIVHTARSNLAALRTEQGSYAEAEELHLAAIAGLTRLFGADALRTVAAKESYTALLLILDRLDEAEPLARESLSIKRSVFGPEHIDTFRAMDYLATVLRRRGDLEGAIALLEELVALSRKRLGDTHDYTLGSVSKLADTLREAGRLDDAEPLARLSLDLHIERFGEDHQETPDLMNALAAILQGRKKLEDAERVYRDAYRICARVLGPEHGRTYMAAQNLASILWLQGETASAEAIAGPSREGLEKAFGPENVLTLRAKSQHACMLWQLGRRDQAIELLRAALETQTRVYGEEDFDRLQSLNYLAQFMRDAGDLDEASRLLGEAHGLQTRLLGPDHPETLLSVQFLMLVQEARGETEAATELARELVRGRTAVFGGRHVDVLTAKDSLARLLRVHGHPEEAVPLLEEIVPLAPEVLSPDHILVFRFSVHLADAYMRVGRFEDAEPYLVRGVAGIEAYVGPSHPITTSAAALAVKLYEELGLPDQVARYEAYLPTDR